MKEPNAVIPVRDPGSRTGLPVARTLAVLGETLDPAAWTILGQASTLAGCVVQHLGSGPAPAGLAPALVIGGLVAGWRRLPTRVSEVADALFPGIPVVLLCQETLAQPVVELAGGRLVLVPAGVAPEALADLFRRLIAQPGRGPAAARIQRWQGETWNALQVDGQANAVIPRPDGVLAVHAAEAAARIAGDLDRIAEACSDLRTAERLVPGHLYPGSVAMVRLVDDAWLLARAGGIAPHLMSRARLPAAWTMASPMRWIPAKSGDVVVVASQLPEGITPGMPGETMAEALAAAAIPALIIEQRR